MGKPQITAREYAESLFSDILDMIEAGKIVGSAEIDRLQNAMNMLAPRKPAQAAIPAPASKPTGNRLPLTPGGKARIFLAVSSVEGGSIPPEWYYVITLVGQKSGTMQCGFAERSDAMVTALREASERGL